MVKVGSTYDIKCEGDDCYIRAVVKEYPFITCEDELVDGTSIYYPNAKIGFAFLESDCSLTHASIDEDDELGEFYLDIIEVLYV